MGEYFGKFSARALAPHPIHLQAALVHPIPDKGILEYKQAFTCFIEEDKRQCITVYWGNGAPTYNLTVEVKKGRVAIEEQTPGVFTLLHILDGELPSEEESMECALYVSALPGVDFKIADSKATVFAEEDTIIITSPYGAVSLSFSGQNGTWAGHIAKANRSFRSRPQGYAAYDIKIGRRTLRRQSEAKTAMKLDLRGLGVEPA